MDAALDLAIQQAAQDLRHHGYANIPNIIPASLCDQTIDDIWTWICQLSPGIDRHDPATWKAKHGQPRWPANIHGIFQHFEVAHQHFVWTIRKHPRVRYVFERLWGDNDLLSSFDGICVMKPAPVRAGKQWLHTDQSRHKTGVHCIQGLLNLQPVGPQDATLLVRSGSHLQHAAMMAAHEGTKDWHKFDAAELAGLRECPSVRVLGDKGSLTLWDSRTVHSNVNALLPNRPRYVVYTCYQPRRLASQRDLQTKRRAWDEYRVTSHWPSEGVRLFAKKPRDYGKPFRHAPLAQLRTRDLVEDVDMRRLAGIETLPGHLRRQTQPLLA